MYVNNAKGMFRFSSVLIIVTRMGATVLHYTTLPILFLINVLLFNTTFRIWTSYCVLTDATSCGEKVWRSVEFRLCIYVLK